MATNFVTNLSLPRADADMDNNGYTTKKSMWLVVTSGRLQILQPSMSFENILRRPRRSCPNCPTQPREEFGKYSGIIIYRSCMFETKRRWEHVWEMRSFHFHNLTHLTSLYRLLCKCLNDGEYHTSRSTCNVDTPTHTHKHTFIHCLVDVHLDIYCLLLL